ncbi:hypothetical protein KC717_01520 [Candidatus Dojkabacteria bacterium]|uniref:Nucleoside 2-deoxyribosyltransferase n=1 Tax=Candidatus Dojkabacteria bacterium TaxID=2099670 RepID=A0A955L828_9BACT|nr:hypothetical protein [Candidatus Dojkabacteria bacterium]
MKIYFASSSSFYQEHKDEFSYIKDIIRKLNNGEVSSITDVKNEGDYNDVSKLLSKAERVMKECDVLIAEGSNPSAGLGYDIAKAVSLKKQVLVLIKSESDNIAEEKVTPHPMRQNSKAITYAKYNEKSVESTIKKFITDSKKKLDTKFILIIPPEIDQYLEWASDNRRMHKAQIVRNAIEDAMEKDNEWQEAR